MSERLFIHTIPTHLGPFAAASTATHLLRVLLPPADADKLSKLVRDDSPEAELINGGEVNERFAMQLREYLEGARTVFEVAYRIVAPPFYTRVLEAVARVPYGHTATYADIAAAVGKPGAGRAVGAANARNRLPIIIPCHRIVASHGLGGYGGGLTLKRQLLALEGAGQQQSFHLNNY